MYLKIFLILIVLSVINQTTCIKLYGNDLCSFEHYRCKGGLNELKTIKSVITDLDRIYFVLEDKFIVFRITFDDTQMLMSGFLNVLRGCCSPSERKFNSSFIPARSKILGHFTAKSDVQMELVGNATNLDAYQLDFYEIDRNTAYFSDWVLSEPTPEVLRGLFAEAIRSKEYLNDINYVLFNAIYSSPDAILYEFDYHDSKLTASRYVFGTLDLRFLDQKILSTEKRIKFAAVLRFKEGRPPFEHIDVNKIYVLEVNEDFEIHLNQINRHSLMIEKVSIFDLDEFFGCPPEKSNK